jgi:energy-coupling factor transporter ATP-binding protein EcfA2
MLNLITGPKGSGKTQQLIDLANQLVKSSQGNVVLIKKSQRNTSTADFNIRVTAMDHFKEITTLEEFVGFLYGMVAGNHDIETICIDGVLKQANINLDSLPDFLYKVNKISLEYEIEFYLTLSVEKDNLPDLGELEYKIVG